GTDRSDSSKGCAGSGAATLLQGPHTGQKVIGLQTKLNRRDTSVGDDPGVGMPCRHDPRERTVGGVVIRQRPDPYTVQRPCTNGHRRHFYPPERAKASLRLAGVAEVREGGRLNVDATVSPGSDGIGLRSGWHVPT